MTDKVVQLVQVSAGGEGNTKPPQKAIRPKQCNPNKRWCFTWNNYTKENMETIIKRFSAISAHYIVGEEVGEKGTKHLQGYVEFKGRIRPLSVIDFKEIHWEVAKGNQEQNIKYCSKEGSSVTNFEMEEEVKVLDEVRFYPYQKWLVEKLREEPDDRTVYWIWDETGRIGKSAFAKHVVVKMNAICVDGKANDIFNGIANFKDSTKRFPKIVIVDCPRHNIDYMNYGAIEKVKNGLVFNGKYESKQLIFNSPHVVVFANSPPDRTKFSDDRWVVKKIKNKLSEII